MTDVFFALTAGRVCCVAQYKQVACQSGKHCFSFFVSLSNVAVRGCPGGCRLSYARKILCSVVPPVGGRGLGGGGPEGGWGGPKKLLCRGPNQLSAVLIFRDAVKHPV